MKYLLSIFALLLMFIQCKPDTATEKNEINIQVNQAPDHLLPYLGRKYESSLIQSLMFYSLWGLDPLSNEEKPFLAKNIPTLQKQENGSLFMKIELNPAATWSNNEKISADDVLFTLKVLATPTLNSPYSAIYKPIQSAEKLSDTSLQLTIGSCGLAIEKIIGYLKPLPVAFFDKQTTFDQYSLEEITAWKEEDVPQAIGSIIENIINFKPESAKNIPVSGPYKIDTLSSDFYQLAMVKDYWGNNTSQDHLKAYPKKLDFQFLSNSNTITAMLRSNELNVVTDINVSLIEELKKSEKFLDKYQLETKNVPIFYYFALNLKKEKLTSAAVRKALAMTLNLDGFIENVLKDNAVRLHSPVHPANTFYRKDLDPIPFDPQKAKTILRMNGWDDNDGDGVLDKGNKKLSFEILLSTTSKDGKALAEIWSQAAAEVGIEITPVFKTNDFIRSALMDDNYDILSTGASSGIKYIDLSNRWGTEGHQNYTHYSNAKLDSLLNRIQTGCLDDSGYNEAYGLIQELLYKDVPAIMLFTKNDFIILDKTFSQPGILMESPYIHFQYMKKAS